MKDHPRSRGVYVALFPTCERLSGSSPLARGLPGRPGAGASADGIIPARAGFTSWDPAYDNFKKDHPRSRGVYGVQVFDSETRAGSSPLARGLPPTNFPSVVGGGIIPARAGFTVHRHPRHRDGRDHPRSRGVYRKGGVGYELVRGSSPLARGLPVRPGGEALADRIIPARAGFTRRRTTWRTRSTDHPRSRGVYCGGLRVQRHFHGSSPLARGLRQLGGLDVDGPRIIPARAGFTRDTTIRAAQKKDHPRSRGVYTDFSTPTSSWRGSSPLARGLLDSLQSYHNPGRIIPARAGFTRSK